jgi:hypothetical protein
VAAHPASDAHGASSDEPPWWKIGLPAGAAVAIIAGLVLGLRRRRRPAAGGPPPDASDGEPLSSGDRAGSSRRPPGDVKVAGAPTAPDEDDVPPSWQTHPNPIQDPADDHENGKTADGKKTRDEPYGDEATHS